jgi:ribosome-associated toxin RatA of RatAB toxin-antitoxin module
MRQVERSAIVPYPAAAMFDLVADVESYPRFLPGCAAAHLRSLDSGAVVATLVIERGPLRTRFTTQNVLTRPERIAMELVSGPFSELSGAWTFRPLGEQGCRVSLGLRFAFDSRLKDLLLGPAFELLCGDLVDAFVRRAAAVHR